jgi:FkbM family methyltransferase
MSTGPKKKKVVPIVEQPLNFVIFDIGCGNGSRAAQWATQDKGAHVFCFDPLEECIVQAVQKSSHDSVKGRLHPVQTAVSSVALAVSVGMGITAPFYIANDLSSCSLLPLGTPEAILKWKYPPGKVHFRTVGTRQVPLIRMDKFMADRRITRVIFCRIETQGTALDVLKSFGKRLRDVMEFAVKVHVTDFEIYAGQTQKQDLLEFMNSNGFALYGIEKYSRDQEEIIWFVNRAFAKQALLHLDFPKSKPKLR